MFVHSFDDASAVLVALHTGARTDDEMAKADAAMLRANDLARAQSRGALFCITIDPSWELASSRERKKIAETVDVCGAMPSLFVIITPSAAARGIVTAVSWLSMRNQRARITTSATLDDAAKDIEAFRPEVLASVRKMDRALRGSAASIQPPRSVSEMMKKAV